MKAIILAAGYATRLYPLTKEYPKPLLTVGKRPIIDYIMDKFSEIDEINEIIVATNSKFVSIFNTWAYELKSKKRLTVIDDLTRSHADRRGAIGDMLFVIEGCKIADDLLVIGGDNLFDGSLYDFVAFAKVHHPSPVVGVYDIKQKDQATKYGVVELNGKNQIVDFQEKPKDPRSTLIAMCLYYFSKEKLKFIKEYFNNVKTDKRDATGFYIDWLRLQEDVYGFVFHGRWYDIGHHDLYHEAKEKFS
jgi:glucose-1-phosphate thymidylyltransferase